MTLQHTYAIRPDRPLPEHQFVADVLAGVSIRRDDFLLSSAPLTQSKEQ
jgi:hypothetical protein